MLGLLLQNRLHALINSFRRGGKKNRRRLLGYLGLIILPLLVLFNMHALMSEMMRNPALGLSAVHLLTRNILLGIFIMLLFSGLALVLHVFFLSKDLPLLMSSPLPMTTLFQFKFIETSLANSTLFFGIAVPILVSTGLALQASLLYWLLLLPLCLLFLTIPTGLSAFLAMGLVSIMPARRAKNISAIMLSIISIGIWLGFQLLRPGSLQPGTAVLPGQRYLDAGARLATWVPSDWLVNSLLLTSQHRYAAAAGNAFLLIMISLLLYLSTSGLLQRALRRDTFSGREMSSHKRKINRRTTLARHSNLFVNMVQRDFRIILRDTQQLIQILLFTSMMILLPIINRRTTESETGTFADYLPLLFRFIFSGLIGSSLATRMIPMERTAFGLFKLAPVRLRIVWLAKMSVSFVFTMVSGFFAASVVAFFNHTPLTAFIRVLILLGVLNIGATTCGGVFGALFPNFEWDHPKRMLSAGSGFLMSLLLFVYMAILGASVAVSIYLLDTPDPGIIVSALITFIAFAFGTVSAEKRLDIIEWTH